MRLVDELAMARGELTEEEKKAAFEVKVKEEFEKVKQECRDANAKKIRKIEGVYTTDPRLVDYVSDLLRKEGLNTEKISGEHPNAKYPTAFSVYLAWHWLEISW